MTDLPKVLDDKLTEALNSLATATLTYQLQARGIRSTFLSGLKPMHPKKRMVGRARTLRYVALREDQSGHYSSGKINAQRRLVEATEPGDVIVMEARGVPDAATIGDIYATRVCSLGGVGIVTDGALRDTPAIEEIGIPVYYRSSHGATLGRQHMPFSTDEPISCAGVFVAPGDLVVGDGEGVVVIPFALAAEVVQDALAQEEREDFALERVAAGDSTYGLFPNLSEERQKEFAAWRRAREQENSK